jgi:hypothetical protein
MTEDDLAALLGGTDRDVARLLEELGYARKPPAEGPA